MRKFSYALLTLTLIGCTTPKSSTQPAPSHDIAVMAAKGQAVQSVPTGFTTQIMYYYPPEGSVAQFLGIVSGSFYWQDGCIYLLQLNPDQTIRRRTAMFPHRPEDAVSWDEATQTLTLRGGADEYTFKMGDYISTNGYNVGSGYDPDAMAENEDEKRCLAQDGISFVGTYNMTKIAGNQNE